LTLLAGPRPGNRSRRTRTRARMVPRRPPAPPVPVRRLHDSAARPASASHRRSTSPRGHWMLVSLVIFVFAVGLVIEGYTHGVLGENSADEPAAAPKAAAAPAAVTGGGPVVQVTGSQVTSYSLPTRTAVLTFDDGPDPAWTPRVLAVLHRYRVPATF